MGTTNILFISASAGNGHTRAAEALRLHAGGADVSADVSATHIDLLKFVSPLLRAVYTTVYSNMVKHAPGLWRHVYQSTHLAEAGGTAHLLRRRTERINSARFIREIEKIAPDLIVCTHFLAADLLSQMIAQGKLHCPVWVQVTDFDLHRSWVHEHMAGYFVANEEVAFRLRAHGIAQAQIHNTGIPIMPVFSGHLDRAECARELGILPYRMTLLLMGGGPGFGAVNDIAARLLHAHADLQIIALAGRDPATLAELKETAANYPGRLSPQPHTDKIERLMACADIVITKPGGLTTSECLAVGLPMVVIAPIPGQEEHNANFLLERGAAFMAFDLLTLEYRIDYLLTHPARLAEMRANARALGKPDAASQVLATILKQVK